MGFGPWFITRFTRLLLRGSNNQKCNSSKFAFQRVLAEGNSYICATLEHNSDPSVPRRKKQKKDFRQKNLLPFPNLPFPFCPCTSELLPQLEPSGWLQGLCKQLQCCQLLRRDSVLWVLTQAKGRARWWGQALLRQCRGLVPPWPRLGMLPHPSYILWFGTWVTQETLRVSVAEAYWQEKRRGKKGHIINWFKKIIFYVHQRQSLWNNQYWITHWALILQL